jgi:hypothetical protein
VDVDNMSHALPHMDSIKYLGVTLDASLNFDDHVAHVCSKISKAIGILKYCKFLPTPVLITMYNAIILPHFDYCSTVWGSTTQKNLTRLQRLQSRAMRCILKLPAHTHVDEMLTQLKWMSVRQRIVFNQIVFMWKILNDKTPSYLREPVSYVHEVHSRTTRNSSNDSLFIPRLHKRSFMFNGCTMWNKLDFTTRHTDSFNIFKKSCTKFVFTNVQQF